MSTPRFKSFWSAYQPSPKPMPLGNGQSAFWFNAGRWRDADCILLLQAPATPRLAWHSKLEPQEREVLVHRNPTNPTTVGRVFQLTEADWTWVLARKEVVEEALKRQTGCNHVVYLVRA